ncbi:MAG: CapA family protein [Chloroflexi bacterium]|nr:CapA family protein [Chloroflexota bacterium]
MKTEITIAVAGESIISRRISVLTDDRFLSIIKILREADVRFTHLETLIHDYDGPEVYPGAEGGNTWMRSPRFGADELKWAGFDIASLTPNHILDYSYGGLFSTWEALNKAGIVHAGSGRNLGEAREPAYLDTARGRVALVSMCSSFAGGARAGEVRRDMNGRPGVNPLRYYWVAGPENLEAVKRLFIRMGYHISKGGNKVWLFNPPGLHNVLTKFVEGDEPGISTVAEEQDVEGNLRAIKDAARQADYVLAHLHSHEWNPDKGSNVPAAFIPPFARACIDAGAHIFISDGREQLKGIEIYKGRPILNSRGNLLGMSDTVTRQPADFYLSPRMGPEVRGWQATPADAYDAREKWVYLNPPKPSPPPVDGCVIPFCSLGQDGKLTELKLYPLRMTRKPRSMIGLPTLAEGETAERIIAYLGALSAPCGTKIEYKDGKGFVKL